ncbi:ACP S-malonyltransferase [Actinomadura rupiterrae]|uniref:ACP S-malonyltransferase n=1 Tax=Actinomadura rupiterrae TaxID=559627 RepID=UPI0020A24832|nr:acyltransferase domain-containing protein [Actinomadura rupiterrae]MCP2343269.1 [acyl-carrier-protein] S-malonyltransferase [Actinomadura rupiterrae]
MTPTPPPWTSRLDHDEVCAFLFPGTGAAGAPDLRALAASGPVYARAVDDVLDAVDQALPPPAAEPSGPSASPPAGSSAGLSVTRAAEGVPVPGGWPSMRRILLDEPDDYRAAARAPGVAQLAAYTASVAVDRVLRAAGTVPAFTVGQSFGEIAALVCAGAFSVGDGARMAFTLVDVLARRGAGGGMGLLEASEDDTLAIIAEAAREARAVRERQAVRRAHRVRPGGRVPARAAAAGTVVVACLNAPSATVVSGPDAELEAVLEAARDRHVRAVRLAVPYLSHHPAMAGADHEWYETIRRFPQRPLQARVHSPVRGRAYRDDDDLHRALADCIVRPVRLPATLREVAEAGATVFVEAGAGDALCRCARLTVPDVATLAPLRERPRPGATPPVGKSAPGVLPEDAPVRLPARPQPHAGSPAEPRAESGAEAREEAPDH